MFIAVNQTNIICIQPKKFLLGGTIRILFLVNFIGDTSIFRGETEMYAICMGTAQLNWFKNGWLSMTACCSRQDFFTNKKCAARTIKKIYLRRLDDLQTTQIILYLIHLMTYWLERNTPDAYCNGLHCIKEIENSTWDMGDMLNMNINL